MIKVQLIVYLRQGVFKIVTAKTIDELHWKYFSMTLPLTLQEAVNIL